MKEYKCNIQKLHRTDTIATLSLQNIEIHIDY